MTIFTTLIIQLLPLYFLILLGYLAYRWLNVEGNNIAKVLFYFITPVVFFGGVAKTEIDLSIVSIPILTFLLSTSIGLLSYFLTGKIWHDNTRNVLALAAGTGNTGYFGLPVALILFDEAVIGIYLAAIIGVSLFESSVGFYITAKGTHTARECFIKVLKLPVLYAFLLGIIVGSFNIQFTSPIENFFISMRGAYTVLGMMMVGLGLASVTSLKLDLKFVSLAFAMKFIAWPLLTLGIIFLDTNFVHLLGQETYPCLILLSIVPMAANTVVIATLLNAQPNKAASAVLLSTIFGLVYVPVMVGLFLG